MNGSTIISLKNVTHIYKANSKSKKELKALDNITTEIPKSKITGFIGLNGAGKTTTIKILSGILHNTSGEVIVSGLSPFKNRIEFTKHIGVMFGQLNQLLSSLNLDDNFELIRRIYGINKNVYQERIDYFLHLLNLTEKRTTAARYLSFGQSVKANLICSLLHNPNILLLDEPTIGVDILSKDNINSFLQKINSELKTSILITSHDIYNIEKIVDHIVLVDKGKLLFNGSIDDFKMKYKTLTKISFELNTKTISTEIQTQIANLFSGMNYTGLCFNNNTCSFFIPANLNAFDFISKINTEMQLKNILVSEQNLEEVVKLAVQGEVLNE